jgi:putative DNA primase/helicase
MERVCAQAGIAPRDLFQQPRAANGHRRIVATYDSCSIDGHLLFQVVRLDPKTFRQRRPDPASPGQWLWDLDGVEPVLYRLPESRQAVEAGQTIYIPEGEKHVDALRALGLAATTNPMGAGTWRDAYSEALRGARVVILPDNDDPGRRHVQQVAQSLQGKAASIKVVQLPWLPEKAAWTPTNVPPPPAAPIGTPWD